MNPQFPVVFSPFLALLYVLFALLQALRGKRQGTFAVLLAFTAAALSLAAYVLTGETPALRTRLEQAMLLNALVAFAASLLILLIERRRKNRDPSRSYGMIGIGLSILLALGTYVTPLLTNAVPSDSPTSTAAANRPDTTLQTISALTPGAVVNPNLPEATEAAMPEATPEAQPASGELAAVLSAQTGLSSDELTTELTAGGTLAGLVGAHDGDLEAVTEAITAALDALVASGGRGGQLLSQLGTSTASIVEMIVQGQLPAQAQERVTTMLLGTGNGGQGANFPLPNGDNSSAALDGSLPPNGDGTPALNGQGSGGEFPPPNADGSGAPADLPQMQPTSTPAPQSSLPPTSTIQRPTRIVFPTVTATPDAAETTAQASDEAPAADCTLVTNYNLNLRDKPTKDGSNVQLSIPMGTTVSADSRTSDGWYHVEYDGRDGWVSGDYASASPNCADLPAQ